MYQQRGSSEELRVFGSMGSGHYPPNPIAHPYGQCEIQACLILLLGPWFGVLDNSGWTRRTRNCCLLGAALSIFYQKWLNFIGIPMNFKQKVLHFIGVFVDFTKAFASSLLFLKRYLFLVIKHFETPPFILDDLRRSEAKIRDNFSYLTDRLTTQWGRRSSRFPKLDGSRQS